MNHDKRGWMAGLALGTFLGLTTAASAGPIFNQQPCDCPPTHYPILHYTTPAIYRWAAWCRGPAYYTFGKTFHPDLPVVYKAHLYHCPSINPLKFSGDHYPGIAAPPPSSQFPSTLELSRGQIYGPKAEKVTDPGKEDLFLDPSRTR
jgi:hypothetical protein